MYNFHGVLHLVLTTQAHTKKKEREKPVPTLFLLINTPQISIYTPFVCLHCIIVYNNYDLMTNSQNNFCTNIKFCQKIKGKTVVPSCVPVPKQRDKSALIPRDNNSWFGCVYNNLFSYKRTREQTPQSFKELNWFKDELGRGSFSTVFKAALASGNPKCIAVKELT